MIDAYYFVLPGLGPGTHEKPASFGHGSCMAGPGPAKTIE
jgi:hypothetical protein